MLDNKKVNQTKHNKQISTNKTSFPVFHLEVPQPVAVNLRGSLAVLEIQKQVESAIPRAKDGPNPHYGARSSEQIGGNPRIWGLLLRRRKFDAPNWS